MEMYYQYITFSSGGTKFMELSNQFNVIAKFFDVLRF